MGLFLCDSYKDGLFYLFLADPPLVKLQHASAVVRDGPVTNNQEPYLSHASAVLSYT